MEVAATANGSDGSKKRVYKVVLTGGPCGGKTTGQSRLCAFFENLGWKVYRNPEEAFRFLNGGITFNELEEDQAVEFQEDLLNVMIGGENLFFKYAELSKRNCLVICDRGTMDALSYVKKEKWDGIMNRNNLNLVELRDNRYHQIIHMVSAACGAEDFYTSQGHATRHENLEIARGVDTRTAEAWVGHPYIDVIDNSTDFETKIKRMINAVCQKMGIDTGDRLEPASRKLKFLVKGPLPDDSVFPAFQDFTVEHVYLRSNSKKMQTRLRKRGINGVSSYTQTIRMPEKLGQIVEVKTAISDRVWKHMLQTMVDNHHLKIFKTRKCFLHNNQYFQLDIYEKPCHPRCEGLIFLETYSALSPDELKRRIPSFLNNIEDVTGKPEYSMFNLSLKDEWKNSSKFCHNIADSTDSEEETGYVSAADYLPSPVSTIHLCPQFDRSTIGLRSVQTQTSETFGDEAVRRYLPVNGLGLKLR